MIQSEQIVFADTLPITFIVVEVKVKKVTFSLHKPC